MSGTEWEILLLSARVALLSVLVSLVPGVLLGWLLARWDGRLRALVQGLVFLPLVLPPVVTGYLLLSVLGTSGAVGAFFHDVLGLRLAYSTTACVLAASVVGFPLLVEGVRLAVRSCSPGTSPEKRGPFRSRCSCC